MTPSMERIIVEDCKWRVVHFCNAPFKTSVFQRSLLIDPNTQRLNCTAFHACTPLGTGSYARDMTPVAQHKDHKR